MADIQISGLSQTTTPSDSDLLLIRHSTTDTKIQFSDLKSAITQNQLFVSDDGVITDEANQYYNKSQIDTKVSNLQTQINTLNSNCIPQQLTNTDLNTLITPNRRYYAGGNNGCTNVPTGVASFSLDIIKVSGGYMQQVLRSTSLEQYERQYNGSSWNEWRKQPTRAEVDALNSKTKQFPVFVANEFSRMDYNNATISFADITSEWMLAKGSDAPNGNFWYVHTFAYSKDNSGHVLNGRQVIYGYATANKSDIYHRQCTSGTWTAWEKQPERSEIDALNSNIGGASFMKSNIGQQTSYNLSSGYRGCLMIIDSTVSHCGLYLLFANGSGAIDKKGVSEATNVSIDHSTANVITITPSSGTRMLLFITALGTITKQ